MDYNTIQDILRKQEFENVMNSQNPILKSRELDFGFTFTIIIADTSINFLIGFKKNFPLSLPQYFILNYDDHEFIPHIEEDGRVCYVQDDYLFIDVDRPEDVISETFNKVKGTVEKGLRKENFVDFTTEFEAYWKRIRKNETVYFNGLISNEVTEIKIGAGKTSKLIVTEPNDFLQSGKRFFNPKDGGFTFQNGIYIPLQSNNVIIPPRYSTTISIDYVNHLIANNTNENKIDKIQKLAKRPCKAQEYVIFSIKHNDGTTSLFGMKFSNMDRTIHPLLSNDFRGRITPISIARLDKEYMYRRGSNGVMHDKKGIIIGAGSIGGFIAEGLIRNGFFNLTVVDGDNISVDNCYRHLVGFNSLNKNKAEAVKKYLENKFPHCNIKAEKSEIEHLIVQGKILLSDYDFAIIATGNVTVNVFLNNLINVSDLNIPVLFSWNDPYGIGGHCLITNMQKTGCYRCLYSNENKTNSASFANPAQHKTFLKNASGCGTFFTPYGSADSMQTSLLTIRRLIDLFTNGETKNAIYSWKGKPDIFLHEGYKLSPRFFMSELEIDETKYQFINTQCKTCNHQHN